VLGEAVVPAGHDPELLGIAGRREEVPRARHGDGAVAFGVLEEEPGAPREGGHGAPQVGPGQPRLEPRAVDGPAALAAASAAAACNPQNAPMLEPR
jgi:hypothetical protein